MAEEVQLPRQTACCRPRRRVRPADVDAELTRFFLAAHHHFDRERPSTRAGSQDHARSYALAGRTLRVHYADATVAALLHPALHHLGIAADDGAVAGPVDEPPIGAPSADAAASLTVRAWADERGGAPLPLPPWDAVEFVERGNTRVSSTRRWMLAYDRKPGLFSALDVERGDALYWAHDASQLEELERARPFRRLISAWLHGAGILSVHAAAVGTAAGAALICGRTGSGKSTTAISCIGSALGYLGDDIVLVDAGTAGTPRLHSLYSSAKLNRDVLTWRPDLAAGVVNAGRLHREKALVHVGVSWPTAVVRSAPLRVLVVPRLSDVHRTTARPITPNEVFKAMVPDTLFTTMGPAGDMIAAIGRLVRTTPAVELRLGRDLDVLPTVLGAIIESAA